MNRSVFRFSQYSLLVVLLISLSGAASANAFERLFAPKSELWERWQQHDANSSDQIDHILWEQFLQQNVMRSDDGVARIAYAKVSGKDKSALAAYIADLSSLKVSGYSRDEQFAYWVNLYNALTVQVVLEHYPVKSIRDIDISPGLFSDGPWGKKLVSVEGEALRLDDIEHRILRPIWSDPRIHYAVNCASVGCPDLQPEAFTAANTERLLEQAARDYINHPRGVSVNESWIMLSSIYNWFASDFDADGGVLDHIEQYAAEDLLAALKNNTQIRGYDYDWALNDRMAQDG